MDLMGRTWVVHWTSASGWRPEAGSCKRDNGPYGSTKMREIFHGTTTNGKVEANNLLVFHHNCIALNLQSSGSPTIYFIIIIIITTTTTIIIMHLLT